MLQKKSFGMAKALEFEAEYEIELASLQTRAFERMLELRLAFLCVTILVMLWKKHFLWRWHRLHLASPQHFDAVMTHLVVDGGTDNGKPHSICLVAKNFKIKVWEHFRVIPVWELKKKSRDTLTRATLSLTENGKLANQIAREFPFLESKKRCELLCWSVFKWLSKVIGRTNFFGIGLRPSFENRSQTYCLTDSRLFCGTKTDEAMETSETGFSFWGYSKHAQVT